MRRVTVQAIAWVAFGVTSMDVSAQHNPGEDCFSCHTTFTLAGTVFSDTSGTSTVPGVRVTLTDPDGITVTVEETNADGNISTPLVPAGSYLIDIGPVSSRTWHTIPGQSSCNTCHVIGGNRSETRSKRFPSYHTALPAQNACTHCHVGKQSRLIKTGVC